MIQLKSWSNSRKSLLIILLVPFFYFINVLSNWKLLEISGIKGTSIYEDLRSILVSGKCYSSIGVHVFSPDKSHQYCLYNYGKPLVSLLSKIHISPDFSGWLGLVGVIAVLAVLIFQSINRIAMNSMLFQASLLLSPSIWLLLERGNFDEYMFFGVLLAAFAVKSKHPYAGAMIIFVSAIFKFYTLPLLLLFFFIKKTRKFRVFIFLLSLCATYSVISDYKIITRVPPTWFISFGLPYPGLFINLILKHIHSSKYLISNNQALLIGLIFAVLLLTIEYYLRGKSLFAKAFEEIKGKSFDLTNWMLGVVHLSCFLVGMNYDYRMIFEILLLVRVGNINSEKNII